jgi:lysophospholipid acyltransferase
MPSEKPALKHLFNLGITLLFFFVLRLYAAFLQLLASVLGTYYLARYHNGSSMPWIVFASVQTRTCLGFFH